MICLRYGNFQPIENRTFGIHTAVVGAENPIVSSLIVSICAVQEYHCCLDEVARMSVYS